MYFKLNLKKYILPPSAILYISVILYGCKKFISIGPPPTSITKATVYSSNTSAAAAVTGIYTSMVANGTNTNSFSSGLSSISLLVGLASDELKSYTSATPYSQFYSNSLTSSTNGNSNNYFWAGLYNELYDVNSVLEGLNESSTLTDSIRQQLIGEAKFMRAFLHFYAVNLYGDVPLVTTTNYQTNNTISRTPSTQVYQQIVSDLRDAQAKLKDKYADYQGLSTSARIRPNRGAANALLARIYLYQQKWDSAEAQASLLINDTKYSLGDFINTFLSTSPEAIWQLQPVASGYNTFDAPYFVLTSTPGTGNFYVALSDSLAKTFEPGDKRFSNWVKTFTSPSPIKTYYYPFKYQVYKTNQPVTEYLMVLRLAEQYLIRAEARTHLNNFGGAQSDLNVIRKRAGLSIITPNTQNDLLSAIMHERQAEFFTEWGHRWFDLKRTKMVDSVMAQVTSQKGGAWNSNWALMPLPLSEITINPNLKQNPGYN